MLKRFRMLAAVGIAVAALSTAALGAGNWSTLPVVGSSSYCASTVSGTGNLGGITGQGQGTLGSICAQTVPAGPSIVTGNEVIPADLNNPGNITSTQGGSSPTTVLLPLAAIGALPPFYQTLLPSAATNTITVSPLIGKLIILGSAALSPTTVQMPAAPIDGQTLALTANQTIGTVTISPNAGQTIDSKALVTAITPSTTGSYGYDFIYRAANTTWYRLQ